MPLPLIAVALLFVGTSASTGVLATKATTRIRRWWNEGEIIEVRCPWCEDSGPHEFSFIDRSWTASILTGVVAGAVGGTVSGAIAKRVFACKSCGASMYEDGKRQGLNMDDILTFIKTEANKFAVLGEQKVGKTCLIKFLTEGSLPTSPASTLSAKPTDSGRRFKLKDLKLKIPPLTDLPGSSDEYKVWKKITNGADIVLYLFRVDQLMEEDKPTEARVRKDMGQIKIWLKAKPKEFPLFLIGTHCDLTDPDFTTLSLVERSNYKDKVREMPMFQKMVTTRRR